MSIKVETKKTVDDRGRIGYTITKVEALKAHRLPNLYFKKRKGGAPVLWMERWGGVESLAIKSSPDADIQRIIEGKFYTAKKIQRLWVLCEKAGDHLREVNRTLAQIRDVWNGKHTLEA